MPETTTQPEDSGSGEQTTAATSQGAPSGSGQTVTSAAREDTTRSSRPQMGDFPGMDGTAKQKDPMVLVLLGASVLVLLAGLGFALKFKR